MASLEPAADSILAASGSRFDRPGVNQEGDAQVGSMQARVCLERVRG